MTFIPSTCLVARRATRTRKKMQRLGHAENNAQESSLEVTICCKYERQLSSYAIFEPGKGPRPKRSGTATTEASVTSVCTNPDFCDVDASTAATATATSTATKRRPRRTRRVKQVSSYEDDSIVRIKKRPSPPRRSGRRAKKKCEEDTSTPLKLDMSKLKQRALTPFLKEAYNTSGIVHVYEDLDQSDCDDVQEQVHEISNESIIKFREWIHCQNLRNLALKLFLKNKSTDPMSNRSAAIECDSSPLEIAAVGVEEDSIFKSPPEAEDSKLSHSGTFNGQASNGLNYDFSFIRKKRLPTTGMQTPRFRHGGASAPLVQEFSSQGRMYLEPASTSTPKNPLYASGSFNFDPFKSGNALSNSMPDISRSLKPLVQDKSSKRTDLKANTRRGLLTDHLNSSDSIRRLQLSACRSGIFSTHHNNNEPKDSWELWGCYFNVLIERNTVLGSGSFAKVYKAKLRSFLGLKSDEGNDLDPFFSLVENNCAACKNLRVLDCAVKSIKPTKGSNSQYTREREMMLHFNCNVLKPLACRRVFDSEGTADQLLMPMAQGDLLTMLSNLFQKRTSSVSQPGERVKIVGLCEDEAKFLFYQILSGVAFIQMCFQGDVYRHCDLKLANVVVYCDKTQVYDPMKWRLCIADFGSAILLHPTLQLEGIAQSKFTPDLSKQWSSNIEGQLTTFTRGTVRYNAPEVLSFDKSGQLRRDDFRRLASAYKQLDPHLLAPPCLKDVKPKAWSQLQYNAKLATYTPKSIRMPIPLDKENVEFYLMSITTDLWSCGIVLAELCKFGTKVAVPGAQAPSSESSSKVHNDIKSSLGAGLFCRTFRDKSVKSDEMLNKVLAQEIAECCNVDYSARMENIKRLLSSRERPDYSPEFYDLLTRLLAYEPHQRPIAAEALGHDWFNNVDFDALDRLGIGARHLPMGHFYSLSNNKVNLTSNATGNTGGMVVGGFGSSTASSSSATSVISPNNLDLASPNSAPPKSSTPFDYGNSDLFLCTLGNFGKLNQRGHAWYTGPLHYRLNLLQEHLGATIRLNDYVIRICSREALVLENREARLFGARGYILSALMQIKGDFQLDWSQVTSSWCAHVLGKLLSRYKIEDSF